MKAATIDVKNDAKAVTDQGMLIVASVTLAIAPSLNGASAAVQKVMLRKYKAIFECPRRVTLLVYFPGLNAGYLHNSR